MHFLASCLYTIFAPAREQEQTSEKWYSIAISSSLNLSLSCLSKSVAELEWNRGEKMFSICKLGNVDNLLKGKREKKIIYILNEP